MTIVISSSLVVGSAEADLPAGTPIIGYRNVLFDAGVVATNRAVAGFSYTNLANPSTYLRWVGFEYANQAEAIYVTTNDSEEIDYFAVAGHNFGSSQIATTLEKGVLNTFQKIMLNFDGADASTTMTDTALGGGAHTWTANGNAQLDTADFKFGGSSLLLDGNGDWVGSADHADFNLAGTTAFTIQFWFKCNEPAGTQKYMCGQFDGVNANSSFAIYRTTANKIQAFLISSGGASTTTVNSITSFTDGVNPGWHHLEFSWNGTTLRLFIDGVLHDSQSFLASPNNATTGFGIGSIGNLNPGTVGWKGWIDQFEYLVGTVLHTATFTPPIMPSDFGIWTGLVQDVILPDDSPVIFRFTPQVIPYIRLRLAIGANPPQAAVVYVGKLLVLERSFDINSDHVVLKQGRKKKVATGFSEQGNFLGRIITQQYRESKAEFRHFTPDWYRENMDPFIIASATVPFFFGWNPDNYPYEAGYAWMTNDPTPETSTVTGRISVTLEMRGVT